jgi:hypothetical protein
VKERKNQSRDWIGSFVEVPKQRRIKQSEREIKPI